MSGHVVNLLKYKNLLYELIIRDIKVRYKRSVLGLLWSILNPFFMMIITTIVFSNLFKFDINNFPLYLLTGQILFSFFSESSTMAMNSILSNSHMIKKIYIPMYIFPISKSISALVNMLFAIPTLLIIMIYTGHPFSWNLLWIPVPILLIMLFSMGLGLILASLSVFFRDTIHLFGIVLTALNYLTPIFYPLKIIPDNFKWYILYNPLYYYVELFRDVIYYSKPPEIPALIICAVMSLISIVIGLFVLYKKKDKFILHI